MQSDRGLRFPFLRVLLSVSLSATLPTLSAQRATDGVAPKRSERVVEPAGSSALRLGDRHSAGAAETLELLDVRWGRLVDAYGLTAEGRPTARPVYRDLVVHDHLQSDGVDYHLESDPLTHVTRLVILRPVATSQFQDLLRRAEADLPLLGADSSAHGSLRRATLASVPRDATLVLRFNDLLRDGAVAQRALAEAVELWTADSSEAATRFSARVLFDPNHGGFAQGRWHSSRVLVDLTTSPLEAARMGVPLPTNLIGLPQAEVDAGRPNLTLRLAAGPRAQRARSPRASLANLAGSTLRPAQGGDVVRRFVASSGSDVNAGRLLDQERPRIVGSFPVDVESAAADPNGVAALDFLVDLRFSTPCAAAPQPGDVLEVGARFLRVLDNALTPDPSGFVGAVSVRLLDDRGIVPSQLVGPAVFETPYSSSRGIDPACFVRFLPAAGVPPAAQVDPNSQALLRFTEPMDPTSVEAFGGFQIVRGTSSAPTPFDFVVGEVEASSDLVEFVFAPLLPLNHDAGSADPYRVEISTRPRDLAGNPLQEGLVAEFTLDPSAPEERNGGFALQFAAVDELRPGSSDWRGQFFYDFEEEAVRARAPVRSSVPVDRTQPMVAAMIPFPLGVRDPLNPLGSKVQAAWRYADLGWQVEDETKFNMDVEGLSWSPIAGQVVADFFPEFEIALSHGAQLPDEALSAFLLPLFPASGLFGAPNLFADNVLDDPGSPQKVVHPRALGYTVDPSDLYLSTGGTPLMPFPLNRADVDRRTYTWRDTTVLAKGGDGGAGIPTQQEVRLGLDPGPAGRVAGAGEVPSIGLPLLMEFRAFPSGNAVGLNRLDVSLAINSSVQPTFRNFSSGGVLPGGTVVLKNPDLEPVPTGGINPQTGLSTLPSDNVVVLGQVDLVARQSVMHSAWVDTASGTGLAAQDVAGGVVEALTPGASSVVVEYRGASGFSAGADDPFDAATLDAYGDLRAGSVTPAGSGAWSADPEALDGARYVQVRITLENDVDAWLLPSVLSLGLAYER